jgi:DNA-binding NtrC family response regulator
MADFPVLAVDDDLAVLKTLKIILAQEGIPMIAFSRPEEAATYLTKHHAGLILLDLNYSSDTTSGQEGLAFIKAFRKTENDTPIIVMTGWGTVSIAVQALKLGANDFVEKPWSNPRLISLIQNQRTISENVKDNRRLRAENTLLKQAMRFESGDRLIAASAAMRDILETVDQVADSDASVLLTGENGTGKTQIANLLHSRSRRAAKSFVAVNMGAVPETLFESELFGHIRGAFTDAKTDRIGRVELAHEGTFFMDEIANINLAQQAKLLRMLDQKQFEKIGSSKTQEVDVRIVSATNADLKSLVEKKQFRLDLLFRLNTIEIRLPPLRERAADIPALTDFFLDKFTKKYAKPGLCLGPAAARAMLSYSWPGNIRELAQVVERAVLLCRSGVVDAPDLMLFGTVVDERAGRQVVDADIKPSEYSTATLDEIEDIVIHERLEQFANDVVKAADSLGISRSALYRRLQKPRS